MTIDQEALALEQVFIEETKDILERMREAMSRQEKDASPMIDLIHELFRGVHTIKGAAGACEYESLKKLAHELEVSLSQFKDHVSDVNASTLKQLSDAFDILEEVLLGGMHAPERKIPLIHESKHEKEQPQETSNKPDNIKLPPQGKSETLDATKSQVLRVPLERIQKNFDIISEIFLTRNQMRYLVECRMDGQMSDEDFFQEWEVLDSSLRKNIGELEQVAMSMRMTPIKQLLKRMEKTIQSYSEHSDKKIHVQILGEETELDKKLVDTLGEPLIHLTRNAMDHGIETCQERVASGKPEAATITFDASLLGNEVVLKISDDGRGIDEQAVLRSAQKRGIDTSRVQTKEEAIGLIFLPGLSTRDKTSEISGRGVGMDAVKAYVEEHGGTITVLTAKNQGTTFVLRLPLGVSVIPAIVAKTHNRLVAISTNGIIETRSLPREALIQNGQETFYERDGQFVPCFDLDAFVFSHYESVRLHRQTQIPICVCETHAGLVAFKMQELVANHEIVLKPTPPHLAVAPFVTGVSILATGEPIFVISLSQLFEKVIKKSALGHSRGSYAA